MKFLFWCAYEHLNFRIPEFEAISKLFDIELNWIVKSDVLPWVIIDLSEKDALKIISRSISVKFCVHVWAEGDSRENFHQTLKQFSWDDEAQYLGENVSFKVHVETFMKKLSLPDRVEKIETISYVPSLGNVKLDNPDVLFCYLEFNGLDHNNLTEEPQKIFFGRCIGDGQRDLISKLSIKKRKFIGNTTMDPTLSLLMANLALVGAGKLVMDPFVGTGSLLISAAQFGGFVFGGDIDFLTLHAKSRPSRVGQKVRARDESMSANFAQYDLSSQYLDVVVADFSLSPFKDTPMMDCIITDPPYGIREPTEKVGSKNKEKSKEFVELDEKQRLEHYPAKIGYSLKQLLLDLLTFSAMSIPPGGRLVFWLPVIRHEYKEEFLPSHPALKLVANCEQVLSSHTSRRLLVMEKLDVEGGEAKVHESVGNFKDQYYLPYAKTIPKKERLERLAKYGHLNIAEDHDFKL